MYRNTAEAPEQTAFRSWQKKHAAESLKQVGALVLVGILVLLLASTMGRLDTEQFLFVIAALAVIIVLLVIKLKDAHAFMHAAYQQFFHAQVISKDRFRQNDRFRRYRYRAYYLTVSSGGETFEAQCDMNTYLGAAAGQTVLVFCFENGELHAVPD